MARKPSKKVVLEPAGKDLQDFQSKYAEDWRKMLNSAAFQAGVQVLRNRKMNMVSLLTEEQVEKNSREYLSDLRGFLQHENEMFNLHNMTNFTIPFEEPEVYISPEEEAEHEQLRLKHTEQTKKNRYA